MPEAYRNSDYHPRDITVHTHPLEIEAKWRLSSPNECDRIRKMLKQLGGRLKGRHYEVNRIFDDATSQYEQSGKVLRLRFINGGTRARLTLKGKAKYVNGVKQRLELELEVSNGHTMELILAELGFSAVLEYSKTRETWQFVDTEVVFDELPFGYFCELESPHAAIKEVAEALGLDIDKCENRDYPALMREHLQS